MCALGCGEGESYLVGVGGGHSEDGHSEGEALRDQSECVRWAAGRERVTWSVSEADTVRTATPREKLSETRASVCAGLRGGGELPGRCRRRTQ